MTHVELDRTTDERVAEGLRLLGLFGEAPVNTIVELPLDTPREYPATRPVFISSIGSSSE